MIDKIIHKLNVNPFLNGLIIQAFYLGYKKTECSLLMHYVILPIILNGDLRQTLMSSNKNLSIDEFVHRNKIDLINLQDNLWKSRDMTNEALIVLHNNGQIKLSSIIQINETVNYVNYNQDLKQYLRSATYLGILFSNESIENIYKLLNIIP